MKVHGFEVTPEIEQACLAAIRKRRYFVTSAIEAVAIKHGVPQAVRIGRPISMHYAHALLQRERKAGRIKRVGNRWERVEGK